MFLSFYLEYKNKRKKRSEEKRREEKGRVKKRSNLYILYTHKHTHMHSM
jgi:hypothetical protein